MRPLGFRVTARAARALVLGTVGLIVLAACTQSVAPHDYQTVLSQPCNACHTEGGVSNVLSARGQAFAAVANHKADPQAAWAAAVRQYPLPPRSNDGASILVPIAVVALLGVWLFTVIRRRRAPTSSRSTSQ